MNAIHIVPGDSAAGSLREALRLAGRKEDVLTFRDDLSCGPIASMDSIARAAWWNERMDWPEIEHSIRSFWADATQADGRLIVWFGRHSARELAFRMAWAWRMVSRPYHVIDVTGLRVPFRRYDGGEGMIEAAQAVSVIPSPGLAGLLDSEVEASDSEDSTLAKAWTKLMEEDAPFRVVTPNGLASAQEDHFDRLLLAQVDSSWRSIAYVVGRTLADNEHPYLQVGDLTLHDRVIALIEQGAIIAEGDPMDMRGCKVRLAGA